MTSTIQMTGPLEPRSDWTADNCPMARALDVVRTRSAFLILRALYGYTKSGQQLPGSQRSRPAAVGLVGDHLD